MFINKTSNGLNNICGAAITRKRKEMKISQRELADRLQLIGMDVDKNAIQRIEAGKRFVTDIELVYFANVLSLTFQDLLADDN
ncbi:MAG: helix-turn-helix transcriptional regulator [Clostridia bacterium]|nr:helix-turn-helix transcriptional regulator [Clostridia bacterium]